MSVTYKVGAGLYVNVTNRCTNCCEFCIRRYGEGVGSADSLWLEREPSKEEILGEIEASGLTQYSELVFCGYGEPLERFDDVVWVCHALRQTHKIPIRINTNGQSDLICGRETPPELAGIVDVISISLNAPDARTYAKLCSPVFGERTFDAVMKFAADCIRYIPKVILSVVDVIDDEQIARCRALAEGIGAEFRVRSLLTSGSGPTE
ncbi:MAG: TatD family nuclease-associated radical SAM protein [Clostridia bacterium]|nr:TatD family nuclease-associated radical SAM protein [Clostridia bacterium]MDR3644439.1 TatD family nuclease-associated radical SAM protein [Clostridia bacterium]